MRTRDRSPHGPSTARKGTKSALLDDAESLRSPKQPLSSTPTGHLLPIAPSQNGGAKSSTAATQSGVDASQACASCTYMLLAVICPALGFNEKKHGIPKLCEVQQQEV